MISKPLSWHTVYRTDTTFELCTLFGDSNLWMERRTRHRLHDSRDRWSNCIA